MSFSSSKIFVDEIVKCGSHSSESYFVVVLFIMLYKAVSTLSLRVKSQGVTIQLKSIEQYFPVVLFIMLYKMVLTFQFVVEILKCDHSNKSYCYWAVLSCVIVYFAVKVVFTFESVGKITKCRH